MAECIFCRIAGKEASAEIILETDNVISFLDIQPRSPGHSLVIPKRHASRLAELDDEMITGVFKATRDMVKAMQKALQPDAFTIGINDGEQAGQVVAHLHVNIIPRFRGDGGKAIHSVVDNPLQEEISVTAERIRAAMQMCYYLSRLFAIIYAYSERVGLQSVLVAPLGSTFCHYTP